MSFYTNTELRQISKIKEQAIKEGLIPKEKQVKIVHAEKDLMYTLDCGSRRIKATLLNNKWCLSKMK